ncbi:MAG: peptidoglycan-associated lipoprotein Pal [Brevundimonas sp.]|uniref:peptidoglycan-associated lipoprotein Pal n=1 Tax=Brevundimonas sp. TaxID=1871086 RepID=UPI002734B435|nr:peptidoglycan-associated lipoprotein Pal [Brevundimonas sp.]MDP3657069.1 peptidoglycan-associated lipoprotein Pal [Brevundimonas sp.]
MLKPSTLIRLAAVGLTVTAIAACTPRTPVDSGAGNTVPPAGNDRYDNGAGPVSGGNLGAAAPGSEQDFVVNVGDRVYFDLDSYAIRSEAYPRMDAQVAWLQRYPQVTIRIEGNADERGTREYNLALGARRAESVRIYLVQRGISAGRIDTISYGKERPIAAGSNEEAWARNRNAHTAIVSGAVR